MDMDIIGVSNENYRQFMTETQRQQSAIESFQSILDKAASAEAAGNNGIGGTGGTGRTSGTAVNDGTGKTSGTAVNDGTGRTSGTAMNGVTDVNGVTGVNDMTGMTGVTGITDEEDQAIREACESFESYFIQMMFREMRKTSFDQNGFIAKSNAEKIFTDMMDEETSKNATKSGGIGLADMMYRQMTQFRTTAGTEGL